MGLLSALNLQAPATARAATTPPVGGPTPPPPERSGGAAAGSDPRAAAKKLKAAIESQRKTAADAWTRLDAAKPKLKAAVDAARGPAKKALQDKQKLLDKRAGEAKQMLDQAIADLEAIDNPGTRREQLVSMLARRKSGAVVAPDVEVAAKGLEPYRGGANKDVTTTTTAFAGGKSMTEKVRDQRNVGIDGLTLTKGRETETRIGGSAVRSSDEKKTHVSTSGTVTREEKKSIEVETADGRTRKREVGKSTEISAKGGSHTATTSTRNADGSGTATSRTAGIERGDGKAGASMARSRTNTDATGHVTTTSGKASGGMVAGPDGYGGYAGAEGGVKTKSKSGVQSGAVGGLNTNVVASLGEPSGTPAFYPLSLKVNLGASVTLSAGRAKEGGTVGFSVEAKGGATVYMEQTIMLSETEVAGYLKELKKASSGGGAPSSRQELAIISAGVKQGWAVAQQMYKSGGQPLSKEMITALKRVGDSTEIGGSVTAGGGAKVNVKAISVGASVTETREFSTKATRNEKGTVDVKTHAGKGSEKAGSVGFNAGVIGMEITGSRTVKAWSGYTITIDPKQDVDGKIFAALGKCRRDADYDLFVKTYKSRITVTSRTDGKSKKEASGVGVSVLGQGAKIGTHQGLLEEKTVDGQGRFQKETVVGTAGAGGSIGGWGDSGEDAATAQRDAEGGASLDLEHTHNDTDYGNALEDAARDMFSLVGPGGGVLAKVTGAKKRDNKTKDTTGLHLGTADLKKIGQIVLTNRGRWNRAIRRPDEIADWNKAGNAIAAAGGDPGVVAAELARFVGGDRIERLQRVEEFVRPGGDVSMGSAYEFPNSLKGKRKDYERLVEGDFEAELTKLAKAGGDPLALSRAATLYAEFDVLFKAFQLAGDFSRPNAKAEMLSAMTQRRTEILGAMRRYGGHDSAADDAKAKEEEVQRLLHLCIDYGVEQSGLLKKLDDLLDGDHRFGVANGDSKDAKGYIHKLEDLHARWRIDYDRAVEMARAVNMRPSRYQQEILMPKTGEVARFRKAAYMD